MLYQMSYYPILFLSKKGRFSDPLLWSISESNR